MTTPLRLAAALLVLALLAFGVAGWQLLTSERTDAARPLAPGAAPMPAEQTPDGAEADAAWVTRVGEATGIGERALAAYAGASLRLADEQPGCGMGWNTLAAIGQVESEHGTIDGSVLDESGRADPGIVGIALDGTQGTARIVDTDGGELDGDTRWDRAVGPMQFIPSTWARFAADGNGDGNEDVQNIDDAALAAARYLCADGRDLREPQAWVAAVRSYNDSVEYTAQVARIATDWSAAP